MPIATTRRRISTRSTSPRCASLELQARLIVEGYLSGMHKSPYHGFSVEFAQHREYVPGDDLKHLDWKVYGRTGTLLPQAVRGGNQPRLLDLLDISESMRYGSRAGVTQVRLRLHGRRRGLAYLVLHQQDAVGLVTFDTQVRTFLKPSSQPSHLKEMVNLMNQGGGAREDRRMAPALPRPGRAHQSPGLDLRLLSDLFDECPTCLRASSTCGTSATRSCFGTSSTAPSWTFPFQEATLFRGLEQYPELLTDPRSLARQLPGTVRSLRQANCSAAAATRTSTTCNCAPTRRSTWRYRATLPIE